jgi:2-polyprenyl-6-methoxyphenol hydroxylase-like FAD-dependent oxidoreductase
MSEAQLRPRRAEIVGGGFAGLAAATALAQRGWEVRVHERGDGLRTTGAGIYVYENGLRVLEALGALDEAIAGASVARTREVRDARNRLLSVHHWGQSGRVYSILRQRLINALAAAATRAGAHIMLASEGVAVTPDAGLTLADGASVEADLVIAADGVNSKLRDALGLVAKRKALPDGAIRLLIDKTPQERAAGDTGTTTEYWSGTHRILHTPCSEGEIYLALTMLDHDQAARAVPIDVALWGRWFPPLEGLIGRIGASGRYDRFELIKLKSWSSGRVAVLGDAAHALPPNLGQGGGCAMMNALSLAVHLEGVSDIQAALAAWERRERPLTEHTQRMSQFFGMATTWPSPLQRLFFHVTGRSKRIAELRTRTARHRPTGTEPKATSS